MTGYHVDNAIYTPSQSSLCYETKAESCSAITHRDYGNTPISTYFSGGTCRYGTGTLVPQPTCELECALPTSIPDSSKNELPVVEVDSSSSTCPAVCDYANTYPFTYPDEDNDPSNNNVVCVCNQGYVLDGDYCVVADSNGCNSNQYYDGNQCQQIVDCSDKEGDIQTLCTDSLTFDLMTVQYNGCVYSECGANNPACTTGLYATTSTASGKKCRVFSGTGASAATINADEIIATSPNDIKITVNQNGTKLVEIPTLETVVTVGVDNTPTLSESSINLVDSIIQETYETLSDIATQAGYVEDDTQTVDINGTEYTVSSNPNNFSVVEGQTYDTEIITSNDDGSITTATITATAQQGLDDNSPIASGGGGLVGSGSSGTGQSNGGDNGNTDGSIDGSGNENNDGSGDNQDVVDKLQEVKEEIKEELKVSGTASTSCDAPPVCDESKPECSILKQQWFDTCGGSDLIEQINNEGIDFGDGQVDVVKDISLLPLLSDITSFNESGSCPPDVSITILKKTHYIKSKPFCDFALGIRPLVLLVGTFLIILIVARST